MIWKDIKNYEGHYQVSDSGLIKNIRTEKLLTLEKVHTGYLRTCLWKNNKKERMYVHRIVLESFVGPSNLQTNHIDGNKQNNNLNNLEWVTPSKNTKHNFNIGLKCMKGENHSCNKLNESQVKEIYKLAHSGNFLRKEIADMYNISVTHVTAIKYKRTWGHILNKEGFDE